MHDLEQFIAQRNSESAGYAHKLSDDVLALDTNDKRSFVGLDTIKMSVTQVISAEIPDRYGDIVVSAGIDTSNHKRNPVVLFNHSSDHPIGKAETPEGEYTVVTEPKRLIATTYFSQKSKEAEQVFALIVEGILRGSSIGFRPIKMRLLPGQDEKSAMPPGFLIEACDLIEFSQTPIPANPDALTLTLDANKIDGHELSPILYRSLLPFKLSCKSGVSVPELPMAKEIEKPNDSAPVTKTDETPVDSAYESEPTTDERPMGAQVLEGCFDRLMELASFIDESSTKTENPEVIESLISLTDEIHDLSGVVAKTFGQIYPDLDQLAVAQADEDDEDATEDQVRGFAAARERLQKRVAKLLEKRAARPNQTPPTSAAQEAEFAKLVELVRKQLASSAARDAKIEKQVKLLRRGR